MSLSLTKSRAGSPMPEIAIPLDDATKRHLGAYLVCQAAYLRLMLEKDLLFHVLLKDAHRALASESAKLAGEPSSQVIARVDHALADLSQLVSFLLPSKQRQLLLPIYRASDRIIRDDTQLHDLLAIFCKADHPVWNGIAHFLHDYRETLRRAGGHLVTISESPAERHATIQGLLETIKWIGHLIDWSPIGTLHGTDLCELLFRAYDGSPLHSPAAVMMLEKAETATVGMPIMEMMFKASQKSFDLNHPQVSAPIYVLQVGLPWKTIDTIVFTDALVERIHRQLVDSFERDTGVV